MRLLEHEAKQLLKTFNIPVPKSTLIYPHNAADIFFPVVLKSQVPIGGRGKAGGVAIVSSAEEFAFQKKRMLQRPIKGLMPKALLAEEFVQIQKEHYLSFLIERASGTVRLVAHTNGGIEVEDNNSGSYFNKDITKQSAANVAKEAAVFLGYDKKLESLIKNLFEVFTKSDATLLEINPLIFTKQDTFICGDCKMELDDAAAFRHPEWNFEEGQTDASFVVLNKNGNIATIANGAGLAMATVDAVTGRGMIPANFLDIGGGATTDSVLAAFQKFQKFPHVKAIIINIFAGITRCDQIARAIIEANEKIPGLPPLFIRLAGTNFEEAVALLTEKSIPTLGTLEDCLDEAKKVIS